jgi:FkbM family methyltransferase
MKTAVIVGQNYPDATLDELVKIHDRVIVFEPLPEAANACRERYANQPGVFVVQAACGSRFDHAELRVYNTQGLSSSLGLMTQAAVDLYSNYDLSEQRVESVQVVNLGYMLGMLGVRTVNCLIIDAQGMDFAILQTIEPMVRESRVGYLQLEADGGGFRHYSGTPDNSEAAIIAWMDRYPQYKQQRLPDRLEAQPDLVFALQQE